MFHRRVVSGSRRLPQTAFAFMAQAIQLQVDLSGPSCPEVLFSFLWLKEATNIYNFFCFLLNDLIKLLLEDGFKIPVRTCSKVEVSDARSDIFPIS